MEFATCQFAFSAEALVWGATIFRHSFGVGNGKRAEAPEAEISELI